MKTPYVQGSCLNCIPRAEATRWRMKNGQNRLGGRGQVRLRLTQHPNALPASERCPGQPAFPLRQVDAVRGNGPRLQ